MEDRYGSIRLDVLRHRSWSRASDDPPIDRDGLWGIVASGPYMARARTRGLFVPKPSRSVRRQRCRMTELGTTVRGCPLASVAGDGRRYSLGYSVPRWLLLDHLDAN